MTYIAAFRCQGGVVMCADTLETFQDQDYKEYVEKLAIGGTFPISIGGAGVGEIIEAATQEIIDRAQKSKPKTTEALRTLILDSLEKVYRDDVPTLVLNKQARSPELLISAKPKNDDFCIFRVRARRIFDVPQFRIVGWGTKYNNQLLRRLFRNDLTMLQRGNACNIFGFPIDARGSVCRRRDQSDGCYESWSISRESYLYLVS
jgi:hypothetical protein